MKRQHINTDNYEEYFLLYVDNELTDAEKATVEEFVKLHPELKAELDTYLDTKLEMDDLTFEGKETLLRGEHTIHESNIEELQILLLDNELDPAKAADVEAYTKANPSASDNYEWLKKARLEDETIVFPYKSDLYRSEKKPAVVISFAWMRVAVAAAIIIIAGLLWINSENNPQDGSTPVIASVDDSSTSNKGLAKKTETEHNSESAVPETISKEEVVQLEEPQTSNVNPTPKSQTKKTEVVTYATVDRNNITTPDNKREEMVDKAVDETIAMKPVVDLPSTEDTHANEALAMNVKTDYVTEALYRDGGATTEEFSGDEPKQRKGFRGLVRKVNRFYNKATNPDPEKAVVKVANFEIGLPR